MKDRDSRRSSVTIQDVARRAGVGVGTVSRVLNASAGVSEASRRRVLAAIAELSYRPDAAARSLRRRRNEAVGVLVPSFAKHFYVEVVRAVARATAAAGLSLIVFDIERPEERDRVLSRGIVHAPVDGLLVVSLAPSEGELRALTASGLKVVLVDSARPDFASVEVDHVQGAYLAVSHLVQLGHRRVGLIDRPEDPFASEGFGPRLEGYRRAVGEAGLGIDDDLLTTGEYSRQSGQEAMGRLLHRPERPTAVFAASDLQAIGAMEAIRDAGLSVPDDIAVVGYNDVELAEYIGLSTVRLPTLTMGTIGVGLLVDALANAQALPARVRLEGELVVRRTSGAPRS